MTVGRPASLVATCDQWARATHAGTAIEGTAGELLLSWREPEPGPSPAGVPCPARGMATDRLCRIYRLGPDRVDRLATGPTAQGLDYAQLPPPVPILGGSASAPPDGVGFAPVAPAGTTHDFVGIAIDGDDRLFLADRAQRTISVLDLWSRRLLRTIRIATPAHPGRFPMGLAAAGSTVFAVVREPAGLLRLSATRGPSEVELPAEGVPPGFDPSRVAVLHDGTPVVLYHDAAGAALLASPGRPARPIGPASDIVVDHDGALVVAPCPSPDGAAMLRRFALVDGEWTRSHPLDAAGYDGGGLVVTVDGRIGYGTADGFRLAVIGRVEYRTAGHCVTYRLDSGTALNRWGRVLIEACVPDGTECLIGAATTDDEFETALAHVPAEPADCVVAAPSATPPLPPARLVPDPAAAADRLHRRGAPTTPWWWPDGRFDSFEAPVLAPPGRFLWLTVRLRGTSRRTPRVREVRVERTAHGLLRRLPKVYAAHPERADFLHRYLAPLDGFLHDLDVRSRCRDILVDPHGTPAEALDWLASFVGLLLDDRWHVAARRQLVAEIVQLYRARGTVWALTRYLGIFLAGARAVEIAADPAQRGVTPVVIEHFRLRGVGGPLVGTDPMWSSRSVVGAGFRVGGTVGELGERFLDPEDSKASSYASHAHRFTVLIPRPLGADEDAAVRHVLDTERPGHTDYELCTVEAGLRAGRGAHVGISTIVGPTGAFEAAITGSTLLGRRSILGGPSTGIAVEAGRVGVNARVG